MAKARHTNRTEMNSAQNAKLNEENFETEATTTEFDCLDMLFSMKMKTPCAPSRGVRECPFNEKFIVHMQNTTVAKQRCEPIRPCISICNVHGAVEPSRKHTFPSGEAIHNTQTPGCVPTGRWPLGRKRATRSDSRHPKASLVPTSACAAKDATFNRRHRRHHHESPNVFAARRQVVLGRSTVVGVAEDLSQREVIRKL